VGDKAVGLSGAVEDIAAFLVGQPIRVLGPNEAGPPMPSQCPLRAQFLAGGRH
jgi:hypothetical protein